MSKEELHNDMLYHAAISMAKSMLEKYRPYLGTLLSENA